MRMLGAVLALLLLLIQWPLWLGKGSWLRVLHIEAQLQRQRQENQRLQVSNQALDAEVNDLKTGLDAIEERARSELGMIKQHEIFFQILSKP